jgi:hypothetical protein
VNQKGFWGSTNLKKNIATVIEAKQVYNEGETCLTFVRGSETMQLSLLNGTEVVIVNSHDVLSAWRWICMYMSPRPDKPNQVCVYDEKLWHHQKDPIPLEPNDPTAETLGTLYLTSQFADLREILGMAWGGNAPSIQERVGPLDEDVKNVITDRTQFRNGLSEHLAFWIQLANIASSSQGGRFAASRPNLQPTDKGPDGLFMEVGNEDRVVVQSVKNSVSDPTSLISSAGFRDRKSKPNKKKQLDAFWLQVNQQVGIHRLDNLLASICDVLDLSADRRIRTGLLQECIFNAVVVADNRYAGVTLFEAYKHIPRDASRRIATYIGSTEWKAVAEKTREYVIRTLKQSGVW